MDRMDQKIKQIYQKIPKRFKIAFVSAMLVGLIAHMYMFTNKLPNMDDLVGVDNFGVTFKNGRWFLWILGAVAYHLNLVFSMPWLNGLITLFLLACSAGIIVLLLDLKSNIANVIVGAVLVVFPSWTATFFYMFTAPYYALAVLMSVLAVYITIRLKRGFWLAIPLLACSMGIYQAYLPFTATLFVILLIVQVLDEEKKCLEIVKTAFFYLLNLFAGTVVYFVAMKFSLLVTHQRLNTYKGLNSMGKISLDRIPKIFHTIFENFFGVFLNNNLEISYNLITKGMYFALFVVVLILIAQFVAGYVRKADYLKAAEVVVLFFVYILAINSIYIMCSEGIYALMYYSYVFLLIFPLVLLDRSFIKMGDNKKNRGLEWLVTCVLICGIGSYCQYANAEYLSMELSFEQAKSYFTTLITQIKSVDGYTDSCKVAFVGKDIQDETLYRNDVMKRLSMTGRDEALVDAYSREYFIRYYCGFDTQYVSIDNLPTDKISEMPIYPSDGSVQMIDDVVVVKLAEE